MKICTIGLGYIGLPTSAMFALHGSEVIGVDISPNVVETLNKGKIHIEEPGLAEVVEKLVKERKFRASTTPESADAFIIAVPTPNLNDEYKSCDLTYVLEAINKVIPYVKKGNTVIIESTIAPRSMDDYIKPIFETAGFIVGKDLFLVHCPERVLPGKILHELIYNNRIVGGITEACAEAGAHVYSQFVKGEIIKTNAKTAEMSKLMENTYRDVNIALANELAKVCIELGINVLDVIEMANKHPRVNIHQPGPGVGGHCLAVDPYFIVAKAPEQAKIISLARQTNSMMPNYIVECVKKLLQGINKPKISVFGVTYKADVDDVRESPAMEIISLLSKEQYQLAIHDPHVDMLDLRYMSAEDATIGSDLILILTDHKEFKEMNYDNLSANMKNQIIFDTRNCINVKLASSYNTVNLGNLHESFNKKSVVYV